jgi:hypothetical protein
MFRLYQTVIITPYIHGCKRKKLGHAAGSAVIEALRYKPEGRGIDSRWCHWNFLLT